MLSSRVTFYVPSTKNVGTPLTKNERQALITRICNTFADSFGGCTATNGIGYFKSETGKLVKESVTLVTSYHSLETSEALAIVTPLAIAIKSEYGQESIAIETELGIDFI